MAVDFPYKLRRRAGKGWAIRTIKLRMSRKLIYVSGLLACFRCHMDYPDDVWQSRRTDEGFRRDVMAYFEQSFQETPLDITADVLMRHEHLAEAAQKIFGAYDEFLGILSDKGQRDELERLSEQDASKDPVYQRARDLSHKFRDGLLEFFFDKQSGMEELTQHYGVF